MTIRDLLTGCWLAAVFIFTFGHARVLYEPEQQRCAKESKLMTCEGRAGHMAFYAAAFWPLYWSVRINDYIATPQPTDSGKGEG